MFKLFPNISVHWDHFCSQIIIIEEQSIFFDFRYFNNSLSQRIYSIYFTVKYKKLNAFGAYLKSFHMKGNKSTDSKVSC